MLVKELLKNKFCWTKNTSARNLHSVRVSPATKDACQFCLGAAIDITGNIEDNWVKVEVAIRELFPTRTDGFGTISSFNDHPLTTFEDVLLVLEKAKV